MPKTKDNKEKPNFHEDQQLISKKLLGSLEAEVMQCMWETDEATVQHVVKVINDQRPIAYTTVMTVMGHLVDKGLLTRTTEGKKYLYKVAQSREEFLRVTSQNMVHRVLSDFGDLAIAGFMGEISKVKPEKIEELRDLLQEVVDEETQSK